MEKFKQHEVRSYDGYLVDKKIALWSWLTSVSSKHLNLIDEKGNFSLIAVHSPTF